MAASAAVLPTVTNASLGRLRLLVPDRNVLLHLSKRYLSDIVGLPSDAVIRYESRQASRVVDFFEELLQGFVEPVAWRTGLLATSYPETDQDVAIDASAVIKCLADALQLEEVSGREELEFDLANSYRAVPEVTALYVQNFRQETQVTILLAVPKYDDKVMDELLDIEYALQKRHEHCNLAVSYIPQVFKNRREIVHPMARLIFERVDG